MLMIVFRTELLTELQVVVYLYFRLAGQSNLSVVATLYLPLADFSAASSLALTTIKNKQISPELLIDRFLMWPSGSWAHLCPPLHADHRN